ncbi:RNA processing factor [Lithospermum erythrorhizon]|uniref:RNA processing factor n=1 Tax=Lithospermum erythrorhizon TaxID=34254 RepID=A0AAV3NYJ7_LITER
MGFVRTKSEVQNHHQCVQQNKKNPSDDLSHERLMWDILQEKIDTLINNINSSNIMKIVEETVSLDLIKGRGLFCRAVIKSLEATQTPVPILAAFVAAINIEFPDVGYLLLKRIVLQLKSTCKSKDRVQLFNTVKLIAHLVNQSVVIGSFALGLLMFLLQDGSDEASVEAAVSFLIECGNALQDLIPNNLNCIFECLGTILEEGHVSKKLQDHIKELFMMRQAKFEGCPDIPLGLELVDLNDQVTHEICLYYVLDPELSLDEFSSESRIEVGGLLCYQ